MNLQTSRIVGGFAMCLLAAWVAVVAQTAPAVDFQSAIDTIAEKGGGRVMVPPGRHLTGGLVLRSNVELHLESGAILEGRSDKAVYPLVRLPYSEGDWMAVVMAIGVTNVAITGEGEIFGNGSEWPQPMTYGQNQEGWRPRGVFFGNCQGVRLEGFRLRDSASWGIVFKCCEDVIARNVSVDNHANANNDGFDIEARNVLIEDCDVDSGDDAFCIKSNNPDFAVENVVVRRCVARSHCNGFKIGTASHGTMRNIRFERCRTAAPRRDFIDRRPGSENFGKNWFLRPGYPDFPNGVGTSAMAVENVDGGLVEDVSFLEMEIAGFQVPIFVRGGLRVGRSCGTPPSRRRILRNIRFEHVRGCGESPLASSITGVTGLRLKDVLLRDVKVECKGAGIVRSRTALHTPVPELAGAYPDAMMFMDVLLPAYGLYVDKADDVTLDRVSFSLRKGTLDVRPAVLDTARSFPVETSRD